MVLDIEGLTEHATERPGALGLWTQGKEPSKNVHQIDPFRNEGPRRYPVTELEETN